MVKVLRRACLVLPGIALVLSAGPALAAPAPSDSGNLPSIARSTNVLPTALFGLGEVDLSALGVSPTALATVGPDLTASSSSSSGMLVVDDDGLDCPNAPYTSIQAAVTAASAGDTIKVCRGTYIEQVTIPAGKDGLTLFAAAALQAVIKAPPVMASPGAIVRIAGAHDVTIRHFTITGPGGTPCGSIQYGVRVDMNGSATITDNHITEIRDNPFSGCQNGIAVDIGRVADSGVGTGTVVHNLIDKYQKGGVVVSNTGSSAEVAYNEVVGAGPSVLIAQNGIQVSGGAHANVHHNKVSQNVYSPPDTEATGILLFGDLTASVHHNDVFLNEEGIALFLVGNGGADVSYNNSRQNTDTGVIVYDNGTRENVISYNKLFQNGGVDCYDGSTGSHPGGVANEWLKDLGRTEYPSGICKQAGPQ